AVLEDSVALGLVAGQAVQLRDRYPRLAPRAEHDHGGVQGGQRYGHVGGVGGDARVGGAEDRVVAGGSAERRAAAARGALVAGGGGVLEVDAAGALQQVPAGGGGIAQLARGA